MGSDHASPEYLAGLSDLDRARATVAVRWCGARWVTDRLDDLVTRDLTNLATPQAEGDALPSLPIGGFRIRIPGESPFGIEWGDNWQGTASLMELAEGNGWRMIGVSTNAEGADPVVLLGRDRLHIMGKADTIHAAVLLCCAAAAKKEGL